MKNRLWSSSFAVLQKVGKSLMLPVSVLPVAGILLGVGASMANATGISPWLIEMGRIMQAAGGAIFTILPLIFAIGVALGFTDNDGVAALAATVGYFVLVAALGVIGSLFIAKFQPPEALHLTTPQGANVFVEHDLNRQRLNCLNSKGQTTDSFIIAEMEGSSVRCTASDGTSFVLPFSLQQESAEPATYTAGDGSTHSFPVAQSRAEIKKLFGFDSIDTGVFGGILSGLLAALLFNRFYRIRLPQYLGFFAGKRFVPIIVSFASIALAAVLALIWPPIGAAIRDFGNWAAYGNPAAAVTIYGVVERLLLPFGLHHIWNVPFFFEVGNYVNPNTGEVVHGVLSRFFAGDYEAAILGGGFVFKMCALPGAALAIYHCAKPEHKKRVAGIMASAALTSFLTGITEPLEFSFLFVAPMLYGAHALLVGAAYFVTYLLGARLGYSFSQGFIDYILFYNHDIRPWLILILGPIFAVIYYFVFRALILKFNFMTPGREEEEAVQAVTGSGNEFSRELVLAFGGRKNIKAVDACITRLRIELHNLELASQERLKELGASGVVTVGNNMQAIFGPRSENLMTDMREYLQTAGPEADGAASVAVVQPSPAEAVSPDVIELTLAIKEKAKKLLQSLGGSENIQAMAAVAETRIRLEMVDPTLIVSQQLQAEGVEAMTLEGGIVHLISGSDAPAVATALLELMD